MSLCFPVLNTIFGCNYINSGFFAQSCYSGWKPAFAYWFLIHNLLVYMEIMWMANVHFCTLFSSLHNLFQVVFWLQFEIGRSDLADLLDKICIGYCKVFDNGVLHGIPLNIWSKYFSLFFSLIKLVLNKLNIFLSKPIWLWVVGWACDVINIVLSTSSWWILQMCNMAHYLILKFLAIHIQRILACIELWYVDQSWMSSLHAQPEICWYNQQQASRMPLQSEKCLLLA